VFTANGFPPEEKNADKIYIEEGDNQIESPEKGIEEMKIINSDGESDQSDFPCDGKQELADGKIFRNWFRRDEMGDPFVSPALGVTSLRVWGFREIEFGKDYLGTTYSEMFLTQSDKRIKTYVRTLHTLLQSDKAQHHTREAMMDFVDYASARLDRDGSINNKPPKRCRKST
jgi:hypothetical protein